jgi:5-methyltetrahydrofolate--homocysteine methyltransferase
MPSPDALRAALATRVVVADGAMGTSLQAFDLDVTSDFADLEGCNEILSVTRPDVVRAVHDGFLDVGVDAVETNTFGANLANLAEYAIEHRVHELSLAGARIAREAVDERIARDGRDRWVIGSVGPGTRLPSLGHTTYAILRDAYQASAEGLLEGGVDALLVETCQDLLQTKAALNGCRAAMRSLGLDAVLMAQITVETTGTMLLGSETSAALTALAPLGIEVIGLNCATGPAEMHEHLRTLARGASSDLHLSVMPNAGLPVLGASGAEYPLSPAELAIALATFVDEHGLSLVGGCCGTTAQHLAQVVTAVANHTPRLRTPQAEPSVASLYSAVPYRQDASLLLIGERTNANGSRAFRDALLAEDWQATTEIAKGQTRDGAHLLDVCVDYVGRDGVRDVQEVVGRLATSTTLPIVLDSTEPEVLRAGLELLGGRAVINSVNFEDGEGPGSRFDRTMEVAVEHGTALIALTIDEEGQARTVEHKVAIAERLLDTLHSKWGIREEDVLIDCLTFTLGTGQDESRKDGVATIEAIRELSRRRPACQTTLGLSNISFGLNPAARHVLNSVFLDECRKAGLTSAIVHAAQIMPVSRIPADQLSVALDLIYDRRTEDYDPLTVLLTMFENVKPASASDRLAELMALPLAERLSRRIVDGEKQGLGADLDAALEQGWDPLAIVNDTLLGGMKIVGELFGSGQMQLPFVLQSAEVMKAAVAHLEPHMPRVEGESSSKATIVLATVKGDVHDIGKNLVDIILTNNGYRVVNLGIKQPVSAIIDAAEASGADAVGMSGLLVKSTVVMKENLQELNTRGLAGRFPVLLGGAALTRSYVEDDLASIYKGEVFYARDAFEGLRLMEAVANGQLEVIAGEREQRALARTERRAGIKVKAQVAVEDLPSRSQVARGGPVPTPPFWGTRVVKGIGLADFLPWLDERALFSGQWGLRPSKAQTREQLIEAEGRPRLRALLDRVRSEQTLEPAVVYGYFPCHSDGDELVVLGDDGAQAARLSFPRQERDRRLCISDFFRDAQESARLGPDVVAFQVATMGQRISEVAAELFEGNDYRDYLELHGLSVQLAEALAEAWHARIRAELGFAAEDSPVLQDVLSHQAYRGGRYSWGYPACPDLSSQVAVDGLLDFARIGVQLSEEFQLVPEQSTSAIVVHHPDAKYFAA